MRGLTAFVVALYGGLVALGCSSGRADPPSVAAPRAASARPGASPSPPPVDLAVGEVASSTAGADGPISLSTRPGERYLAVVTSAAPGDESFSYRLSAAPETGGATAKVTGCAIDAVTPRAPRRDPARADRAPTLGERRRFWLRRDGATRSLSAEAVAVGRHAVVWADRDPARPAAIDRPFAEAFLADFEAIILPRARLIFGPESDIDGDGRIALLFTPLTKRQGVAFFSGCDLHPHCDGSNAGEVIYLTPPNAIDPPYDTPRAIKEILAHELEHLLHHHQKVLRHPSLEDDPDGLYLHEGFGALAQDVTGFQAGNLYVTKAGLSEIDRTSINPLLEEGRGYDADRDGPLRGIAYLFVRWLYDRAGGDAVDAEGQIVDRGGPTFLRSLLAAPGSVSEALQCRAEADRLVADFYTSLAAPEGGSRSPCFDFLPTVTDPLTKRQRGAGLYARFHGQSMGGAAKFAFPGDGRLRAGGGDLVTIDPAALREDRGPLTLALDVPAQARATFRVMRVE